VGDAIEAEGEMDDGEGKEKMKRRKISSSDGGRQTTAKNQKSMEIMQLGERAGSGSVDNRLARQQQYGAHTHTTP
jgi:hypothetical protein